MGTDIQLDTAAIASTVLEGVLYGFSLLMFCGTMWALVYGRVKAEINKLMLTVAVLFLTLSTTHIVIDIIRIEQGLVMQRNSFAGGPAAFFADVTQSTFISKSSIYTLQTLLGDGVVIYRCYVVWQSFCIIILPCIMWCSVAATGVGTVYTLSHATATASNIFAPVTSQWIKSFYATTLSTNVLSTMLLAYRIWSIDTRVSGIRTTNGPLRPMLAVVIDSGLLYSFTLLTALSCFASDNHGQYVVLDMIMPIISISYYMVMIRVGIAQNNNNSRPEFTTPGGRSACHHNHAALTSDSPYPMNHMQIHIAKITETNDKSLYPCDGSKQTSSSETA